MMMNLEVNIAPGLKLRNPVMTASGTFGYGDECPELVDVNKIGAIVCKGTTLEPRDGNPQPRIAETPAGILNAIGLQNAGVKALVRDMAPLWADWDVPVIVNIAGDKVSEYGEVAARLDGVPGIAGLEVNISCPNVEAGGAAFGMDPQTAASVVTAVRRATKQPLLVKLTADAPDIAAVARAAAAAGADALTVINTLKGMAIDIYRRKPVLGNVTGGLSGPAIKPVALYNVYSVAAAVNIPVIGCGGIASGSDAVEFLMAGATAVQVGTANLSAPDAPLTVLDGIVRFFVEQGIDDVGEIIGAARGA
jgi:dihydroorotate dehydrogenase (NAD+) catalytic subunit